MLLSTANAAAWAMPGETASSPLPIGRSKLQCLGLLEDREKMPGMWQGETFKPKKAAVERAMSQ